MDGRVFIARDITGESDSINSSSSNNNNNSGSSSSSSSNNNNTRDGGGSGDAETADGTEEEGAGAQVRL